MRDQDEQAVRQASEQFYAALNALFTGDLTAMEEVWSHAEDVTYMGPGGGFQVGWPEVRANWQSQAALELGGEVRPESLRITLGQDLAATHCYERGSNLGPEGEPREVAIRATNLFRKENGQWKMIGHHTDLLPFIAD